MGAFCGVALAWMWGPVLTAGPVSYDVRFPPVTTTLDTAARGPLTMPTPRANCRSATVRFAFSKGKMSADSTVSGSLSFEVGPSFSTDGGAVVSWLQAVDGELSVRRSGEDRLWKVRQFNFLDQSARANWDGKTHKLSIFLPVVLTAVGQRDTHAFLVAHGVLDAEKVVWDHISFAFHEMVKKAFPDSPPIAEVFGFAHPGVSR